MRLRGARGVARRPRVLRLEPPRHLRGPRAPPPGKVRAGGVFLALRLHPTGCAVHLGRPRGAAGGAPVAGPERGRDRGLHHRRGARQLRPPALCLRLGARRRLRVAQRQRDGVRLSGALHGPRGASRRAQRSRPHRGGPRLHLPGHPQGGLHPPAARAHLGRHARHRHRQPPHQGRPARVQVRPPPRAAHPRLGRRGRVPLAGARGGLRERGGEHVGRELHHRRGVVRVPRAACGDPAQPAPRARRRRDTRARHGHQLRGRGHPVPVRDRAAPRGHVPVVHVARVRDAGGGGGG
mmetsp:Transcript_39410/g.125777  ORF Transcript_39410/g.125777 Transcript_39410/m.125777 type:complete len:294 (+) Transcript_39410:865-1746(+)